MYPDDRVLVGVINRKRDFKYAHDHHWYRVPQEQMPRGIYAEYVAFFLSGKVFKDQSGGIHYYAKRRGVELLYRKDLLPEEADHPRADKVYYKVQLNDLVPKTPPVLNPTKRSISFILTTWDRFVKAREIRDLYSDADYYVDRIYHALRDARYRPQRYWEAEGRDTGYVPQVRVICENGTVIGTTKTGVKDSILLDDSRSDDDILAEIRAQIAKKGGPVTLNIPLEPDYREPDS
jgi:hypothetical protein